jgi:hypothetical protein
MPHRDLLHPVDLPWKVSPSMSGFRISMVENGDATVAVEVAVLPDVADGALIERTVELRFKHGQWLRTAPASSDDETVPPGLFDWTHVPQLIGDPASGSPEEHLTAFRRAWERTGRCPDPGLYQVEDSRWLHESGAARFRCRHYVLVGHDMWLETLCLELSWRFVDGERTGAIATADVQRVADTVGAPKS